MAAYRCTLCGISYPAKPQFKTCPIHDEPTDRFDNVEPDPDWQEKGKRVYEHAMRQAELRGPIPLARGVAVVEECGRLFVQQGDLWRSGVVISWMQPTQFYLFELEDGWIYETQGWDEPRRRWWVERLAESERPRVES